MEDAIFALFQTWGVERMGLYAHTDDTLSDAADDTARNEDELCHDGSDRRALKIAGDGRRRDAPRKKICFSNPPASPGEIR